MITPSQYTRIYEKHCQVLHDEAERIKNSTTARAWLMKNVGESDPIECLRVALECIYDLTGDQVLRKKGANL